MLRREGISLLVVEVLFQVEERVEEDWRHAAVPQVGQANLGPLLRPDHVEHLKYQKTANLFIYVGTTTQLVILPPHIPLKGQKGGILLLRYSTVCVSDLTIFDLNRRGEKRSSLKPNS